MLENKCNRSILDVPPERWPSTLKKTRMAFAFHSTWITIVVCLTAGDDP